MTERGPEEFARIAAQEFAAPEARRRAAPVRRRWIVSFSVLSVLALVAVALLWQWSFFPDRSGETGRAAPAPAASPPVTTSSAPVSAPHAPAVTTPPAGTAAPPPPPTPARPWHDLELAAARRAAQDVLAQVLDKKRELEERRVALWGAEDFDAALALATQGDAQYRERRFEAALARYQESLGALNALVERAPHVIGESLATGNTALANGDADAAARAYRRVLAIEPDNPAASVGLARAEVYDEVVRVMVRAAQYERDGELEAAKSEYQRALQLDAQTPDAGAGVRRIDAKLRDRAFHHAMSEGYAALDEGHLDAARRAFESALELKPDAEDARSALTMTANRETERAIRVGLDRALEHETQERWEAARGAYAEVLNLDASVAAAQSGIQRAQGRARLDVLLAAAVNAPERLQNDEVYDQARKLRDRAVGVNAPGPRLRGQIQTLEALLASARQPVTVVFRSDAATDVNVYKVGRFGKFHEKEIQLKPGRYVAVGTREGYRDVRREFQVAAGHDPLDVVVACTEKIAY